MCVACCPSAKRAHMADGRVQKANALTQRSLKEFSPVFRDGFTLVVPQNQVPTAQGDRPLFQRFGINAESISEVNATAVRARAFGVSGLPRVLDAAGACRRRCRL